MSEWTTDRPTKSGWYWWRWNHGTPVMRYYSHAQGTDKLWRVDDNAHLHEVESDALSEWAGPIEEPTERAS